MKPIILTLAVLLAAVSVSAQTESQSISPCNLTMAQAPALRGVKLGMTAEDLFAMFPEGHSADWVKSKLAAANEYPAMGGWQEGLSPSLLNNTRDHSPISSFHVFFFDGRVVSMEMAYTNFPHDIGWDGVDHFLTKISDAFHLPASSTWTTINEGGRKALHCRAFTITGWTLGGTAAIQIQSLGFQSTVKDRKAVYEQTTRREFKP